MIGKQNLYYGILNACIFLVIPSMWFLILFLFILKPSCPRETTSFYFIGVGIGFLCMEIYYSLMEWWLGRKEKKE